MRLFTPLAATGVTAALIVAVVAGLAAGPGAAVAVIAALALWLAFTAVFRARGAAAGRALPAWSPDDERPLGDTPELHDRLSPHDVPKSHPSRLALERAARDDAR